LDVSPAVAARDEAILAAAEQLEADTGKRPTRKEVADYVRRTTGESCSAARVSQAYRRRKEAEAEATGGTVKRERAPGAGRKKAPLLDVVADLCERVLELTAARRTTSERNTLPRGLYGAARKLRQRKGWRRQLEQLVAPKPAEPEQLELGLNSLETVQQTIAAIKRDLDAAEGDAERRQHRATLRDFVTLEMRLKPPERSGKAEVDTDKLDAWEGEVLARLRQIADRTREEQLEEREQINEGLRRDELWTPELREGLRRHGLLPKEGESEANQRAEQKLP
jgi:hypothetical protein